MLIKDIDLHFTLENTGDKGLTFMKISVTAQTMTPSEFMRLISAAAAEPGQVLQKPDPVPMPPGPGPAKKSHHKKTERAERASVRKIKCPYCDRILPSVSIHSHAQDRHKDQYDKAAVSAYIQGTKTPAAADPVPGSAGGPAAAGQAPGAIAAGPAAEAQEIRINAHVKLTGACKGVPAKSIGVVNGRKGDAWDVNFGRYGYHAVLSKDLEAV